MAKAKARVAVLGAGFAGLETAFYLRHELGDKVDLILVSDRDYFLFKPNTIYIPFGEDPEKFKIPLEEPARRKNLKFIKDRVRAIDPDQKKVLLSELELAYDYLVIATGADMRPEEVPGLKEHAVTVWTPEEMLRLRAAYARLAEQARDRANRQQLLFLIPPNNRCSGPLYEIVLMTDTWLRRQKIRNHVDIKWSTYEDGFIQAFGPRLNTVVSGEFEERGISGHKGFVVTCVEPNTVLYQNGEQIRFDLLVAFPPYIAGNRYSPLPMDERGFISVDADSRRVKGYAEIFAVGDTADFPIKQAFLALLQADAAADHLAAEIGNKKPEVLYEPVSMCVMEDLNKATFAQVPLKYTGDPKKPVGVAVEDADHYKVGVSPLWRVGKKMLGFYLPWRFRTGEPFHAGAAWEAMNFGLKAMSKVLAR